MRNQCDQIGDAHIQARLAEQHCHLTPMTGLMVKHMQHQRGKVLGRRNTLHDAVGQVVAKVIVGQIP